MDGKVIIKDIERPGAVKIHPGDRYTYCTILDVYRVTTNDRTRTECLVICDCGEIYCTQARTLRQGHSKSCGCKTGVQYCETRYGKTYDPYKSTINNLYGIYKGKAKQRDFDFELTIQDFPLRGNTVYLHIKRRRWLDKKTKQIVQRDWNLVAQGTRMTEQFAAFLKEISR